MSAAVAAPDSVFPSVVAGVRFGGAQLECEIGPYLVAALFFLVWGVVHCSFNAGRACEKRFAIEVVKKRMPSVIYGTPTKKGKFHLFENCGKLQCSYQKFDNGVCSECAYRCFRQKSVLSIKFE